MMVRQIVPSDARLDAWRQDPAYRFAYHVEEASFAALFRAFHDTCATPAPYERPIPLPRRQQGRR
jgi:hypothetical protein